MTEYARVTNALKVIEAKFRVTDDGGKFPTAIRIVMEALAEAERKGENLCTAHGLLLIEKSDLESKLSLCLGALEQISDYTHSSMPMTIKELCNSMQAIAKQAIEEAGD